MYLMYHSVDILPLRPGHTLVIPKVHVSRVSELPAEYAAATGIAISKVSHAITQGMSYTIAVQLSGINMQ